VWCRLGAESPNMRIGNFNVEKLMFLHKLNLLMYDFTWVVLEFQGVFFFKIGLVVDWSYPWFEGFVQTAHVWANTVA
jgi:hypothetical protein